MSTHSDTTHSDTIVDMMDDAELARHASIDAQAGFGALETGRGNLPLEAIDLHAVVTGLAVRMDLVQAFHNPFDQPVEATYIFPLPDRAAVTALRMEADGRIVEGVLKERGQARADYDQAVTEGHRASIAEQERSGVFTMRVGNIMPGERVIMRLSLAGLLPYEDGAATFRFPLVVAPRYIPGTALAGAQVGDGVAADTDAVPDASRITPPVLLPGFPNPVRLSIQVHINPLGDVLPVFHSSLHAVGYAGSDTVSGNWRLVQVRPGERIDRDFVLRIDYRVPHLVTTALTTHRDDSADAASAGTFALTLMPPAEAAVPVRPKNVILLLDRSGSMAGWKLVAARRAAARIVDSLGAQDRLTVWAFDDTIQHPDTLPPGPCEASDRNRFRAVEYLATVTDGGGTELLAPLSRAVDLLQNEPHERRYPDRVIVLITDGQVGNEDQILRALGPRLGDIRIHTVGVDTAVNEGFLRSLAALGGGRCELVESEDRLDQAIRAIHHRIATPLVKHLRLESAGLPLDPATVTPARLPDLFAAAPVVIMGRTAPGAEPTGSVTVVGKTPDGFEWRQTVTASPSDNPALPALWARTRIRDLEDRYASEPSPADTLEREIIDVSLRFSVLSRFTAFVAVDERVVNEAGAVRRIVQPVEAPQGWEMFDQEAAIGGGGPTMAKWRSVARAAVSHMPDVQDMQDAQKPTRAPAVSKKALERATAPTALPAPATASATPKPTTTPAAAAAPAMPEATTTPTVAAASAMPEATVPPAAEPMGPSADVSREAAVARPAVEPREPRDMARRARGRGAESIPLQPVTPPPATPESVKSFAVRARARLLHAAVESFEARSAALVALGAEIEQNIHRFATDGLGERLLRALRDLAADLHGSRVQDRNGVHYLWIRAAELLEYLAGDQELPLSEPGQEELRSQPGRAFWKR